MNSNKQPPAPPQPTQTAPKPKTSHKIKNVVAKHEEKEEKEEEKVVEAPKVKEVFNLSDKLSYKQQQDEHFKTVERERKYQQNKKLREQKEKQEEEDEEESSREVQGPQKRVKKSGRDEGQEDVDSDREKDSQAIDMRREDAELEKILRDYNNESRQSKKKREHAIDRPFDLPFYKGI